MTYENDATDEFTTDLVDEELLGDIVIDDFPVEVIKEKRRSSSAQNSQKQTASDIRRKIEDHLDKKKGRVDEDYLEDYA